MTLRLLQKFLLMPDARPFPGISTLAVWGLPVALGLALGFLIAHDDSFYALILAALAPFVIFFSTRPFLGVIIWLALLPFNAALPNPAIVYWGLHRLLIPLTLVMTVFARLAKEGKRSPIRLGIPELAVGILAILIPVSIWLSPTDIRLVATKYADRMLIPFCMYFIVRLSDLHERENRWLQWTALFIIISQSGIGYLSWVVPGALPRAWGRLFGYRTQGSLEDPAVFTSMLVFCIVLLFRGAMNRKPGLIRTLFLAACCLGATGIIISLERGSWVGGLLVFFGLLILYPRPMLKLSGIGAVVIVLLGASIFSRQFGMVLGRLNQQRTVDDRIVITDAMIQMITEKPVFGWGYETIDQHISRYYRQVGSTYTPPTFFQTSHNTYLTIFTEQGLIGFLLFLYPAGWCLSRTIRAWQMLPEEGLLGRSFLYALWMVALQNFIVSNFMDMRFFPIGLTMWWMTLGFIARIVDPVTVMDSVYRSSRYRQRSSE